MKAQVSQQPLESVITTADRDGCPRLAGAVVRPRVSHQSDLPAPVVQASGEVDLLEAEEVVLVEAPDGLDSCPTSEHAGTFDVSDRLRCVVPWRQPPLWEKPPEGARQQRPELRAEARLGPGRRERGFAAAQSGADQAPAVLGEQPGSEACDIVWADARVRVAEQDEVAGVREGTHAPVAAAAKADVVLLDEHQAGVVPTSDDVDGVVRGVVVDHHDRAETSA
ncbi:MAG: hypothetical protein QOG99_122 [Frankiales bacterium]|nr:hypothetical protein [Frankiales bacterium]